MAELIIHAGKLHGKRLVFPEREIVVGRDEDCQLRLTSNLVSRRHCILDIRPEGIWVRDLASQNGTYVNDVAITDMLKLRPGDILRIGAAVFQVPEMAPSQLGKKSAGRISDADITDWLTDDDHTTGPRSSDSTVILGRDAASTTDSASPDTALTASVPAKDSGSSVIRRASAAPPVQRTVKEEADEIIRLHWESLRTQQPE